MKIYYPHFSYGPGADDSLYYSGSNGKKHLTKEGAIKEAEKEMELNNNNSEYTCFGDCPESYTIIEEEVYE